MNHRRLDVGKTLNFLSKLNLRLQRYHYAAVSIAYLLVIVGLHPAVVSSINTNVIAGQKVGGFFTWLFWWWSFAVHHKLNLFHSPFLMYPDGVEVFFHSPVNEVPAFLIQLISSPYAATNLLSMACQVLTGVSSYFLFFRLTQHRLASLCASIPMVFGTYMMTQHAYGQIIEATQYFNPLLILAVQYRLRENSWKSSAAVGAMLLCVCFSGPYMAYCFAFILFLGAVIYDVVFSNRQVLRLHISEADVAILSACFIIVGIAYWPLLRHTGQWLGGEVRIYSSLASFVLVPFWHRSPFVQNLRFGWFGPEEGLGYLGIGLITFIVYGMVKGLHKTDRNFRFWLWILVWCAILSLGPWLMISPAHKTSIPLPYFIFEHLPVLSSFRSISRIWVTGTLAACILAAISMKRFTQMNSTTVRFVVFAGFVLMTFWEFDVLQIRQWYVSSRPSKAYQTIAEDPEQFAILDLPQGFVKGQGFSTSGYFYMLFQPYHQKPMVHGSPSRCLEENLDFILHTPYVFEVTHPWYLAASLRDPRFKNRNEALIRQGQNMLRDLKIKYIVFHPYSSAATTEEKNILNKWLRDTLGPPVLIDEQERFLYKVYK